jgi:hypothetical protein
MHAPARRHTRRAPVAATRQLPRPCPHCVYPTTHPSPHPPVQPTRPLAHRNPPFRTPPRRTPPAAFAAPAAHAVACTDAACTGPVTACNTAYAKVNWPALTAYLSNTTHVKLSKKGCATATISGTAPTQVRGRLQARSPASTSGGPGALCGCVQGGPGAAQRSSSSARLVRRWARPACSPQRGRSRGGHSMLFVLPAAARGHV